MWGFFSWIWCLVRTWCKNSEKDVVQWRNWPALMAQWCQVFLFGLCALLDRQGLSEMQFMWPSYWAVSYCRLLVWILISEIFQWRLRGCVICLLRSGISNFYFCSQNGILKTVPESLGPLSKSKHVALFLCYGWIPTIVRLALALTSWAGFWWWIRSH